MAIRDVVNLLSEYDGRFDEMSKSYVTIYPLSEERLCVELEYVDEDEETIDRTERYVLDVLED